VAMFLSGFDYNIAYIKRSDKADGLSRTFFKGRMLRFRKEVIKMYRIILMY